MANVYLIVLYKCSVKDSSTLQSLFQCEQYLSAADKLVLWDNSPTRQKDVDIDKLHKKMNNVEYYHTPENISLARIYNKVIAGNSSYDFLFLFDQDSGFTKDFLLKFNYAKEGNKDINLFLPLIYNNETIVSPADFASYKGRYWKHKKTGRVLASDKLAVTSGMIIRMKYLEERFPPFNENLSFYGIDSEFMFNYCCYNEHFYLLDYNFNHSMSVFDSKESTDMKVKRFLSHKSSLIYIVKKYRKNKLLLLRTVMLIKSIQLSIKYKDQRFLR